MPSRAETRPLAILPPFDEGSALAKVQLAENAWNTRDPERVVQAYTEDSRWRNRGEFLVGRDAIRALLARKWQRELDYRLSKELWAFTGNPHLGAVRVREPHRGRDLVAQPRQRALGVRRDDRAHAPPRRERQRHPDLRRRAALAAD